MLVTVINGGENFISYSNNINIPVFVELCHEFKVTYHFLYFFNCIFFHIALKFCMMVQGDLNARAG